MNVTTEMLQAAVRKAAEAGLLPRHARKEEMVINQELIRIVLQAALDAAPGASAMPTAQSRQRRGPGRAAGLLPAPMYYRYFAK